MQQSAPKLLNAAELAAALGNRKTPRTLVIHARRGWIPGRLLGKTWLFELDAVMVAMEANTKPK